MVEASPFRRSSRLGAVLLWGLAAPVALSCRVPVWVERPPGVAPRCEDGLCTQVVSFQSQVQHVGMWIDAPPATRLLNARVTADQGPPCQGTFPVEWVMVDDTLHRTGPVDISGPHGVLLSFPMNTWWNHSGYWRAMFIDVQLEVAGTTRCVRTRLTSDDGKAAADL
jgi:hypothetical protein